jgi:hypothetical protein
MTPSMDFVLDNLNPAETVADKVVKLSEQYKQGKMTKVEYLDELDRIVETEWIALAAREIGE